MFEMPVRDAGLDVAVLVDAEEHGALEALVLGEDAGEGRAGFLGAVFVVAGEEDDVLACAGALGAFVDERLGLERGQRERSAEDGEERFHEWIGLVLRKWMARDRPVTEWERRIYRGMPD